MPKQKIEIEVDVPEGYEATGEYRPSREKEPWIGSYGEMQDFATRVPVIILRKLPDPIPEVEGPIGWPELKWAAKLRMGTWFLCSQEPRKTATAYVGLGTSILAHNLPWTPPPEIADLPPEKSLVKLTHECRWTFRDGEWIPSCTDCCWEMDQKPMYCPECGRKVKGE